jgi:chemotaxis response regulator CheB
MIIFAHTGQLPPPVWHPSSLKEAILKTDLIVIGGSAGAIEPLKEMVSRLPSDFALPILITIHVPADFPSVLPQILSFNGSLPAVHPSNHQRIRPGMIYVAPSACGRSLRDSEPRPTREPAQAIN